MSILSCVLMLTCSPDYNPFTDEGNGRAVVYSNWSNGDTVTIFSSETLYMKIAACLTLSEVKVVTTENRFFNTLTFDSLCNTPEGGRFSFRVSFFDTGFQEIRITSTRNSGSFVVERVKLFVTSALHQSDIVGQCGDTILLSTKPVHDLDVRYTWLIGSTIVSSVPSSSRQIINGFGGGTGKLYVSDLSGKYISPNSEFSFELKDNSRPKVKILNQQKNDTVFTSGKLFNLQIKIEDNDVKTGVVVNGIKATEIEQLRYVREIDGVDTLHSPLQLIVTATDRMFNSGSDTLYLVHDSSAQSIVKPVIELTVPDSNVVSTGRRDWELSGKITYFANESLTYFVAILLNGNAGDTINEITGVTGGNWSFPGVHLINGLNDIQINVLDRAGTIVADTQIAMIYSLEYKDLEDPVIASVQANGVEILSRSRFVSDLNEINLKVICFDAGKGISNVLWNNVPMKLDNVNKYAWTTLVNAQHVKNSSDSITVIDSIGLTTKVFLNITHNNPPAIVNQPDDLLVIHPGIEFRDTISCKDINGDEINYAINDFGQNSNKVKIDNKGALSWLPAVTDSGFKTVYIDVTDSFGGSVSARISLYVDPEMVGKVRISTDPALIPRTISFDDSIKIPLAVVNGKPPYTFTAINRVTSQTVYIDRSIPVFVWKAKTIADTGLQQFSISVQDTLRQTDNVQISFRVLPANRTFTIRERWTGSLKPDGSLNCGNVSTADTLIYLISDPDSSYNEKHTVNVSLGNLVYTLVTDSSSFKIVIDPMRIESGFDTLLIDIMDIGGHVVNVKKTVYYGFPPTIVRAIKPISNDRITESVFDLVWSGTPDPDGDPVLYDLYFGHTDGSFSVAKKDLSDTIFSVQTLKKSGTYYWFIIAHDAKSHTTGERNTFNYRAPDRVQIDTTLSRLPLFLKCDTLYTSRVKLNNGYPPFKVTVSASVTPGPKLGSDASLSWKPDTSEVGRQTVTIFVSDSIGNEDVFTYSTIVSGNHSPKVTFTGAFTRNNLGEIVLSADKEIPCTLSILDPDPSPPEMFTVKVTLGNVEQYFFNDYSDKVAIISLKPQSFTLQKETLKIVVTDSRGNSVECSNVVTLLNPD